MWLVATISSFLGIEGLEWLSRNGDQNVSKYANELLYLDEFHEDNKKMRTQCDGGGESGSTGQGFQGDFSE